MSDNKFSGSEPHESDNFMEWEDDRCYVRVGDCAGANMEEETSVSDTNLGSEYLDSQPRTSGNDGRKRRSQSSYQFAKKVSRSIWNMEPQQQEEPCFIHKSKFHKSSVDASDSFNVATVPEMDMSQVEPPVIRYPGRCDDKSEMLINDGEDNLKGSISSGVIDHACTTPGSSEKTNLSGDFCSFHKETNIHIPKYAGRSHFKIRSDPQSHKSDIYKCANCGLSFSSKINFSQHLRTSGSLDFK